jgi:chaperonin cofactor prefoldin
MLNSSSRILADTKKISGAKISEYDAQVIEAEAKVIEAEAEIIEKRGVLFVTKNNLDSQIEQSVNSYETRVDNLKNQLVLEQKILSTLESNLENANGSKNQKIEEAKNNVLQKQSLLDSKVDEIYTLIMPLVYIGEEDYVDYENIRS